MIDEHFQSKDKTMNTTNRIKLINAMDPIDDTPPRTDRGLPIPGVGRPQAVWPTLRPRPRYRT